MSEKKLNGLKAFRDVVKEVWRIQYFCVGLKHKNKSLFSQYDKEVLSAITRTIEFKKDYILWKFLTCDLAIDFIKEIKQLQNTSILTGIDLHLDQLCTDGSIMSTVVLKNIKFDGIDMEGEIFSQEGGGIGQIGLRLKYTKLDIE